MSAERIPMAEVLLKEPSDALNTQQLTSDKFVIEYAPDERTLYVTPRHLRNVRTWMVSFDGSVAAMSPMSRAEAKALADAKLAKLTAVAPPPPAIGAAANDDEEPVIDPAVPAAGEVRSESGALTKHKVSAKK